MGESMSRMGNILMYQTEKGETRIDVYFEDDTIWMSQKALAQLYQVTPQDIVTHIKQIYSDGELEEKSTCKNSLQVQTEGKGLGQRRTKVYNLEMVLALGYRVRGNGGIHFRKWASSILAEYMKKGFALNDERLRNPKEFGADYFDELLERIRDIRASKKRFEQRMAEIFSLSVDYDEKSSEARKFFSLLQSKLEYAVTGSTGPEIIASRADAEKENMGLTRFPGAKVHKDDVTRSRNYMTDDEIRVLDRIIVMYLDYAEQQAESHRPMYMADWDQKLSEFLKFTKRNILENEEKVTQDLAERLAVEQYEKYEIKRNNAESLVDELLSEAMHLKL